MRKFNRILTPRVKIFIVTIIFALGLSWMLRDVSKNTKAYWAKENELDSLQKVKLKLEIEKLKK